MFIKCILLNLGMFINNSLINVYSCPSNMFIDIFFHLTDMITNVVPICFTHPSGLGSE